MDNLTARRVRLCAAAFLVNLLFIWGNSLIPGPVSASISSFAQEIVNFFLPGTAVEEPPSKARIIRKIAHFLEFCSLSFLLSCLLILLQKPVFYSLPFGAVIACIDECIQFFIPGRAPRIRDVGIDTLGVIAGFGVFTILLAVRKRKNQKHLEENQL